MHFPPHLVSELTCLLTPTLVGSGVQCGLTCGGPLPTGPGVLGLEAGTARVTSRQTSRQRVRNAGS